MGELVGLEIKPFGDASPYGMVYIKAVLLSGPNDEALFGDVNEQPRKVTLNAFGWTKQKLQMTSTSNL